MERDLIAFKKNDREQVRILVSEYHGRRVLNIRVFYLDHSGEWLPSKKGLALGVEKLPILLAALHQVARQIDIDDGVSVEEGEGDFLSEEEQKYLCEKFGVDQSEFDEILGVTS